MDLLVFCVIMDMKISYCLLFDTIRAIDCYNVIKCKSLVYS